MTKAFQILAGIFALLGTLLMHNYPTSGFIFYAIAIASYLISLFAHRKEEPSKATPAALLNNEKELAKHNALLRFKETLISDKVRLSNEVPNNQIMGNVAAVQGVVENLKSILKDTIDIESINTIWDEYYKNEHRRKPFESNGPKRKEAAIKAIDSLIGIIEKNL